MDQQMLEDEQRYYEQEQAQNGGQLSDQQLMEEEQWYYEQEQAQYGGQAQNGEQYSDQQMMEEEQRYYEQEQARQHMALSADDQYDEYNQNVVNDDLGKAYAGFAHLQDEDNARNDAMLQAEERRFSVCEINSVWMLCCPV